MRFKSAEYEISREGRSFGALFRAPHHELCVFLADLYAIRFATHDGIK